MVRSKSARNAAIADVDVVAMLLLMLRRLLFSSLMPITILFSLITDTLIILHYLLMIRQPPITLPLLPLFSPLIFLRH
jgi:hypothetical protein